MMDDILHQQLQTEQRKLEETIFCIIKKTVYLFCRKQIQLQYTEIFLATMTIAGFALLEIG
jgi:hypothetical protein